MGKKNIFVLQALQLFCKREGWKNCSENCIVIHCIVLQRSKLGGLNLGCNTLECIAIEAAGLAKKLYCNTV